MANLRNAEPALTGGMRCGCGDKTIELRGVPRAAALEAVAYVFAKRGVIELTYDGRWWCPVCAQRPGFWIVGEDESAS